MNALDEQATVDNSGQATVRAQSDNTDYRGYRRQTERHRQQASSGNRMQTAGHSQQSAAESNRTQAVSIVQRLRQTIGGKQLAVSTAQDDRKKATGSQPRTAGPRCTHRNRSSQVLGSRQGDLHSKVRY